MNDPQAQAILDKIIGQITGYQNPYKVVDFHSKFAFDIKLPQKVVDAGTGEDVWAMASMPTKYIKVTRAWDIADGWLRPAKAINSMEDILGSWAELNLMAADRHIESQNVHESDAIYNCENVFRCVDCSRSKNLLLCDSVHDSEYVVASQRSNTLQYSARVEDSNTISESFSINWSGKSTKCLFLQDCKDMYECMFCSHTTNRKFMIANMQYDEAEYYRIKKMVIAWLLSQ
jgi:hypothetical protein